MRWLYLIPKINLTQQAYILRPNTKFHRIPFSSFRDERRRQMDGHYLPITCSLYVLVAKIVNNIYLSTKSVLLVFYWNCTSYSESVSYRDTSWSWREKRAWNPRNTPPPLTPHPPSSKAIKLLHNIHTAHSTAAYILFTTTAHLVVTSLPEVTWCSIFTRSAANVEGAGYDYSLVTAILQGCYIKKNKGATFTAGLVTSSLNLSCTHTSGVLHIGPQYERRWLQVGRQRFDFRHKQGPFSSQPTHPISNRNQEFYPPG